MNQEMNQENDTKKKSVKNTTKKLKQQQQQQQQGEKKEKGGMEEKQIEMTTMGATTTLEAMTTTQTSTQTKHLCHSFNVTLLPGSKFGSIEWVLQHKILRRENFYPKDLFALKVWPSLLQNIFIAKFETITNNARNIADAMIPIELYKFLVKSFYA